MKIPSVEKGRRIEIDMRQRIHIHTRSGSFNLILYTHKATQTRKSLRREIKLLKEICSGCAEC